MLSSHDIKQYLATEFDLIGICPAVTPQGLSNFYSWLDAGYAGEMDYLLSRKAAYAHPRFVMEGVRSIIMLGSKYASREVESVNPVAGQVSRYARSGVDYHDIIHRKLKQAIRQFQSMAPEASFRGVVDTAPLLEREFAQLAGLGWQGKNTMLISKTDGSWFFLSALLTSLELTYDQPQETDHCGTCQACLDACPTDAFVAPFVMDGSRCISYFTIESQQLPPREFRQPIDDWLFGCDICQQVCPWNRKGQAYLADETSTESPFSEKGSGYSLNDLHRMLEWSDEEFRTQFRKTPFWRSKRRGILRNIAIVLGNRGDPKSIPHLTRSLQDEEPIIRAASAWALSRFNGEETRLVLQERSLIEQEPLVSDEIELALAEMNQTETK